jgi:hypothetical protein
MYVPNGRKVFIQFSCAANETTDDDLFNKHLLRNIDRANVHITDVFSDIVKDAYHQRRRQLQPYSTSRLPEDKSIYLNEIQMIMGMYRTNINSFDSNLLTLHFEEQTRTT